MSRQFGPAIRSPAFWAQGRYALLRNPSLQQHEKCNDIAQMVDSSRAQTVACSCMDRAVAYYRVSTRQQQRSGLGIEAERAAVERFAPSREHPDHRRVRRSRSRQSGQMLRPDLEAQPAFPRPCLRRRPDGATGPVHRRRTRPRRRCVHAAPLRRACREGTSAHLGTHQGRTRD